MPELNKERRIANSTGEAEVSRLVGVYDAKGSLSGELAYWFGARLGIRHCALCDITHGRVRAKPEWLRRLDGLDVDFTAVHLDEQDPVVARASAGKAPCVVAVREDGSAEIVIDRQALEAMDGDPDVFADLLASGPGHR